MVNPLIYRKLAYDADSYVPLGLVSGSPYLLAVRASLPTQDFAQFAAYAKANPPSSISVRPGRQARRIWGWSC